MYLKKGDSVQVLAGKDRGRRGKVVAILGERAVVEGINLQKRHTKPSQKVLQGGIVKKEGPVHISNLMLVCPKCHTPTRVGRRVLEDGSRARVCKRCGEIVER